MRGPPPAFLPSDAHFQRPHLGVEILERDGVSGGHAGNDAGSALFGGELVCKDRHAQHLIGAGADEILEAEACDQALSG
jgi:hypothetical protein